MPRRPAYGFVADAEFILVPQMESAVNWAYWQKRLFHPF
jgi:hypothetical protein